MQSSIDTTKEAFLSQLAEVKTSHDLEAVKVKFLGKKGPIQQLMQALREQPADQRPVVGKHINDLKEFLERECARALLTLQSKEEAEMQASEALDITLPGRPRLLGNKHPLTGVIDRMIDILRSMGFSVQYGPDVDTDYYNFEVLNFPPDHPARDMQDTFYVSPQTLLRTHTSNIQARVMEKNKPPIRIIAPGKVYRNEAITARSHVFFHQVEAVFVDEGVSFSDLLATLDDFLGKLFQQEIATRYRPSYFPFVEPGVEVDVACFACQAKGCPLCKKSGWLEIAGAGMIHPEVLRNSGIDPDLYSGFAWGLGVERLVMMLKGINDIRLFTENDLRFLRQFRGCL